MNGDKIQEIDESQLRSFYDTDALRTSILDRTKSAFETRFPLEDNDVRIELSNLSYDEDKLYYGPVSEKKAVMSGGRLSVPLRGDFKMINKVTGELLDTKKKHLVANVPYLTERGTFINNGTEYMVSSQTRLRPGVYSRRKENGELEAHVNPKPGTGPSMRVFMEPETGVFRAMIGNSRIKLYPILKGVGVSDDILKQRWGEKVWEQNSKGADDKAFDKFFDKVVGTRANRFRERMEAAAIADDLSIPDEEPEDSGDSVDGPRKTAAALIVVPGKKDVFSVNKGALSQARRMVDKNPSDARAVAGNYAKGHVRIDGLPITIENPKGSIRSGIAPNGARWSSKMECDYGYIKGTVGADGDHLDVFLGPDLSSEIVFIIDQVTQGSGKFDKHKIVFGTKNRQEAKDLYLSNFNAGWKCGNITPMTIQEFRNWITSDDVKSPASERKTAQSRAVDLLISAKKESDRGNYKQKQVILTALMREVPDEFFVDSEDKGISGITHKPSGFRIHTLKGSVPSGVKRLIKTEMGAGDLISIPGAARPKLAALTSSFGPAQADLPRGKGDALTKERASIVVEQLSKMEIDPEISMRNLGHSHSNFGPDTIVDVTSKLLAMNRGEADVDDRDDKANQAFHTVDDFMEERVAKDAGQIGRTLLFRSRYNGSLKGLKSGHFTPQLESLIVGNSLSQAVGGVNPVDLWDARFRITQIGEGGIGSSESIPVEARNVHPSQLGVVDVVRTPESGMVGIDQRLISSARKGPNNQVFIPLIDARTGKKVWRTPSQIYGRRVLFPKFHG